VIRRALADEAEERFQGAGAFADALEVPLRRLADTPEGEAVPPAAGAVVEAAPAPPAAPAGPPRLPRTPVEDDRTMLAPAPPRAAAPAPVIPPPRRRAEPARDNTGRVILIVILLALLVGGAVWAFTQMDGGGPQAPPLSDLPDSAQVDTTQVDSLDAVDAAVMSLEGERAFRAGDYATAEQRFRIAAEADPDQVRYRDYLGAALIRLRRYQEAERVLVDATRVDPNYDLVYSHLAQARVAMGDKEGAIQALRRFLDISMNRTDRDRAQRLLDSLTAPEIVIPPAPQIDSVPITDTVRPAPRDTIRMR
jgi:hypothetical protein